MDTRTIRRLLQGSCATVVSFARASATENPLGMHGEGAAVLISSTVSPPARLARRGERTAPMAGRLGITPETPGAPAGLAYRAASLTLQGLTPAEHEILLEFETASARQHILMVAGATTSVVSPVASCRRAAARRTLLKITRAPIGSYGCSCGAWVAMNGAGLPRQRRSAVRLTSEKRKN